MSWLGAAFTAILLVAGAAFSLIVAIGINRLPDVLTRMHAASKAGTLGSGLLLAAACMHFLDVSVAARAAMGLVFFVLTAPVAAHLLAKAALRAGDCRPQPAWLEESKQSESQEIRSAGD